MKKKTETPITTDEKNIEVLKAFDYIVSKAKELITVFDTEKYRKTVIIDHEQIGKYESLVREFICYHFNITVSKNKHGRLVIYLSYDGEAISKFGNRIFTELLRASFFAVSKANNKTSIEEHIRIDYEPKEIRNFFYKRLMDEQTDHVDIELQERKTA